MPRMECTGSSAPDEDSEQLPSFLPGVQHRLDPQAPPTGIEALAHHAMAPGTLLQWRNTASSKQTPLASQRADGPEAGDTRILTPYEPHEASAKLLNEARPNQPSFGVARVAFLMEDAESGPS